MSIKIPLQKRLPGEGWLQLVHYLRVFQRINPIWPCRLTSFMQDLQMPFGKRCGITLGSWCQLNSLAPLKCRWVHPGNKDKKFLSRHVEFDKSFSKVRKTTVDGWKTSHHSLQCPAQSGFTWTQGFAWQTFLPRFYRSNDGISDSDLGGHDQQNKHTTVWFDKMYSSKQHHNVKTG